MQHLGMLHTNHSHWSGAVVAVGLGVSVGPGDGDSVGSGGGDQLNCRLSLQAPTTVGGLPFLTTTTAQ